MSSEAISDIIELRADGLSWEKIATKIYEIHGILISRKTVKRWYDQAFWEQTPTDYLSPDETLRDKLNTADKKLEAWKAEAVYFRKLYNTTVKNATKELVFSDVIRQVSNSFKEVPQIKRKPLDSKTQHPQTVVAPLTDTHIGEYIDSAQMVGLNSYDMELFNKRLYGWANQLLALINYRRNITEIEELVIPMLGDMISGDIHDELARTNVENNMGQMIKGAYLISQAILLLAPHVKKIRIPCVVGNHGRMSVKPPMKDKVTTDWDYMLYQWISVMLKNQKNITFEIPQAFLHVFNVYDHRILIMHGDSISGAGSNMSISRSISNLRGALQYKNNLNMELEEFRKVNYFDSVMIGHFHRVDETDIGTGELHICGCVKGVDEFALQRLHVSTKPKQIATYWHPLHGYLGKEVIYLSKYDKTDDKFDDSINSTWANMIH